MISIFRRFAKSWVAALLIGLLIISFAIFGVGDVFRTMGADTVVKAGPREINSAEFRREFDGYKQQAEQRVGQPISIDLAIERGLDRQVLEGLAGRESFAELMHRMGVRVSDTMIADQIKKIPAFFDRVSGKFDQNLYAGALAERQLTPESFERYMRDDMAQQHVMASMASGLRAPRAYAALGAAYALETREASWFMVNPSSVPQPAQPTDAQLTAFMKENAAQLTRPEFRQLTVVRFSSAAIEPSVTIDPAEVQKRYDFQKDSLSRPETRTVVQIPAKDAATAARVAQALSAGGDIAAAAKAAGVEPVLYADKPRTAIVDRKVAEAAFSLPAGAVSQPIQGDLGYAVVKVMQVKPGTSVSFAEARPAIEAQLRADAAAEKVYELTQTYEDAHGSGSSLAEAALKAGVQTLQVGPITAKGQAMNGQPSGVPEQILKIAFDLPAGGESDIEEAGKGEYFAVRVEKVIPATLPPLAEVKPALARAYMLRELVKAMQTRADALAARVRKGETLAAVAASAGANVTTVTGVSRAKAQDFNPLGRDFLIKLFTAKPGEAFTAQSPQFGFAVGKLDAVRAARPEQVAGFVEGQRQQLTMDLYRQIGGSAERYARAEIKAKTNLDLARMALGVDPKQIDPKGKAAEPKQ
jgi:peptidyl-prolyl cis-trans isomerase D